MSFLDDIFEEKKVSVWEIIISREWYENYKNDPYNLVDEVINYVNTLIQSYKRNEIPLQAFEIYHTDYYLAQINNWWHSQFILNSKCSAENFSDIENCFIKMNAMDFLQIFKEFTKWISENPEKANKQTWFTWGTDDFLDTLDEKFYKLNKMNSEENYLSILMTQYIHWLDNLRIVKKENIEKALQNILDLNPNKRLKNILRMVWKTEYFLTNKLFYSFSLAGWSNQKIWPLIALWGSLSIDTGELAWVLKTLWWRKMWIIKDDGVYVYEQEIPKEWYDIRLWKQVAFLEDEIIVQRQQLGIKYNAIYAVSLLCNISSIKWNIVSVSIIPQKEDEVTLYITTDTNDNRFIRVSESIAWITDSQNKGFEVCVSKEDLNDFSEKIKLLLEKNKS